MANSTIKIAVMLSAIDHMSKVVNTATSKSIKYLNDVKRASDAYAQSSFNFGRDAIAVGVAGAASLAAPVKSFAELETAMSRVKSVMMTDGGLIDNKSYEETAKTITKLGDAMPGTSADLANMVTKMLENGVAIERVNNGLAEATAKFGAINFGNNYEEAAVFVARFNEQMGVADKDALASLDQINRTRLLGINTSEMGYAFARASGALKQYNFQGLESVKSFSPILATLTKLHASGEIAGSSLSKVLAELGSSKKMAEANAQLSKYGLNLQLFQKDGNFKPIQEVLAQLGELKKLNPKELEGFLNSLTGGIGADNASLLAMIDLGAGGYNKVVDKMKSYATLDAQVAEQLKTSAAKWEAASGTFTNTMAAFGASFSPEMNKLIDWFGTMSSKAGEWIKQNQEVAKWIGITVASVSALAGGIGGVAIAISVGAKLIGISVTPIALMSGAVNWLNFQLFALRFTMVTTVWPAIVSCTTAVWGFTAALLANPITWVVVGLAALAGGIYYAWQKFEQFKGGVLGVWEVVKNLAAPIMALGKALLFPSLDNIKGAIDAVKNIDISKSFNIGYDKGVQNFRDEKGAPAKAAGLADAFAKNNPQFTMAGITQSPASKPAPFAKANTNITYSPTIQIQGSANKTDIQKVVSDSFMDFNRLLKKSKEEEARKGYSGVM